MDHLPCCSPFKQKCAWVRDTLYEEDGYRDHVPALLFTPSLSQLSFLTEKQKRWWRGRRAHARWHLLLKVKVLQLDRAGSSRMMEPSIANLQEPSPIL